MHDTPTDDPMLDVSVFCIECGKPALGSAEGWRACIGGGFDGEPVELAAYCPRCWEREFSREHALLTS